MKKKRERNTNGKKEKKKNIKKSTKIKRQVEGKRRR